MDGKKLWKIPVTKHKFGFVSLLYRLYPTPRVYRIAYYIKFTQRQREFRQLGVSVSENRRFLARLWLVW